MFVNCVINCVINSKKTFIQFWKKIRHWWDSNPRPKKWNKMEIWEFSFSKNIFSNAIFPLTMHSYAYATYSKWKILLQSFRKSRSQVPACTCSIWNFHLKTAILLHKFSRKWFLCWYPLTSNSNFEQFFGQKFTKFPMVHWQALTES